MHAAAVDVSARLNLEGNLANGGKDAATRFIELNEQSQRDPDAFVFSIAGENAGGSLSMVWTFTSDEADGNTSGDTTTTDGKADITIRKASVWFKPVPWAKVTVGTLMQHLYLEYMRFWEDASGSKVGSEKWMNYREGSGIDYGDSGAGIALAITPIQPLTIEVAAAPGTSSDSDDTSGAFWTWDGSTATSYLAWGAVAKYSIGDNATVGVAYADNGLHKYKLLSAGFDVGHPFGTPYYFFIQPRFYFGDKHASEIQYYGYSRNNDVDEYALTGIAIDNWFRFNLGEHVVLQARLPFVARLTGDDDDPSYLLYDLECDYNMGKISPYIEINNCNRIYAPLMFGSKDGYTLSDSFAVDIRPGVKFHFASCEVFTGVDVYFGPGLEKSAAATFYSNSNITTIGWRVPFGVTLTL